MGDSPRKRKHQQFDPEGVEQPLRFDRGLHPRLFTLGRFAALKPEVASLVEVLALRELRPRAAGGTEVDDFIKALRRCTRRYCSQREQRHQSGRLPVGLPSCFMLDNNLTQAYGRFVKG